MKTGIQFRYLISYLHFLLYFRGRKLQNNGLISQFSELSSIINFLAGGLLTFYSPFYALFASSNWRTACKGGYQLYPFRACEKGRTTTHKL